MHSGCRLSEPEANWALLTAFLITTNIYKVGPIIATMLKQANNAQAVLRLSCSRGHMFPSCYLMLIFKLKI